MGIGINAFIRSAGEGLFFILLLAFAIHAIFVTYHWFSYGSSKNTSLIALAIYLSGGAILLLALSIAQSYV
jgi:hypothetical protein